MFCSLGIEGKAAYQKYNTGYAMPQTSDTSGFIEVSTYSSSRDHYLCYVFTWTTTGLAGDVESFPYVDVAVNSGNINFKANVTDGFVLLGWSLDGTSSPNILFNGIPDPYNGYTFTFWSDYKAKAYHVYGNYGGVTGLSGGYNESFSVLYGQDYLLHQKLDELADLLREGNTGGTLPGLIQDGNDLQEEGNKLQEEENKLQEEANQIAEEQKEQEKNFFDNFFGNLVDTILGIFIPSSEEMSDLFDQLNQFFSDTFGFLYYPFDFLIQAFDVFLNSDSSTGITFPGFSIMGYEVWSDMTYDIANEGVAGDIFKYVRIGTGGILGIFFIGYLRAFFDKRFGGGGN